MALLLIDPFSTQGSITNSNELINAINADLFWPGARYFNGSSSYPSIATSISYIPSGDRALVIFPNTSSGSSSWYGGVILPFAAQTGKIFFGFSIYLPGSYNSASYNQTLVFFGLNPTYTADMDQADRLYRSADGSLRLNGVTSAAGQVNLDSLAFIEVEYDLAAGTVSVYVNGDSTPVITSTTTLTSIDKIAFSAWRVNPTGGDTLRVCYRDMYVANDQGSTNNTRLGVVKAAPLPLLASVDTNFTPAGGAATNLDAVNKTDRSTATYNESGSANDVGDSFTLDASGVDAGADIAGVLIYALAGKPAATTRHLALTADDGTTLHSETRDLPTGAFKARTILLEELPSGGAISGADLATLEIGYQAKI